MGNNQPRQQPGFVLITTLFLLFLAAAMVARLIVQVNSYRVIVAKAPEKVRAQHLALNVVSLVQRALSYNGENREELTESKRWLLNNINRWQKIPLDEKTDGITGEIGFYVTSENGKINLNALYDAAKEEFNLLSDDPYKIIFKQIRAATQDSSVEDDLNKTLDEREEEFEDISELLDGSLGKNQKITLFTAIPSERKEQIITPFALTDLFAAEESEPLKMHPFFLSTSVMKMLELKEIPSDDEGRKKIVDALIEQSPLWEKSWQQVWDTIVAPVVGKTVQQLPKELANIFDGASRAYSISVICYGKVNGVTQQLCAILSIHQGDKKQVRYEVRKVYWIS